MNGPKEKGYPIALDWEYPFVLYDLLVTRKSLGFKSGSIARQILALLYIGVKEKKSYPPDISVS